MSKLNREDFIQIIYSTSEQTRNFFWNEDGSAPVYQEIDLAQIANTTHESYKQLWVNGQYQVQGSFPGSRPPDPSGIESGWKLRNENDDKICLAKNPEKNEYLIIGGNNRVMCSLQSQKQNLTIWADVIICILKPVVDAVLRTVRQSNFSSIEIDYQLKSFKIYSLEKRFLRSDKTNVNTIYF